MINLENYKEEKLVIDIGRANIFGFIMIIPCILFYFIPYFLIWGKNFSLPSFNFGFYIIIFLIGIIFHELIHGIVWAIFAKKGFKSIRFGIMWKYLTPYCHCKEPLNVRQYIIGGLMPLILLGVLPSIIAIFIGSFVLLIFGFFFTIAASGDILIVYKLRNEKQNSLVQDHPSEAGCYIYRELDK